MIRRLPPLLKKLREGMESAGVPADKRDEHIRSLNDSLAAAFSAKAAAIPAERFEELRERLEDSSRNCCPTPATCSSTRP